MYMIVGGSGFLGSYLVDELLSYTDRKIIALYHNSKGVYQHKRIEWIRCDITNYQDVEMINSRYCDVEKRIIILSACHNPDYVSDNPRIAWNINIVALTNFVNKIENVDGLIYTSTDSVYGNSIDGHKFTEESRLNPVNMYGRQKALAEHIVTMFGYNVVRLPFMIGSSLAVGKKHFYDMIIENIRNGKPVEMFADSYRSTISFRQAAKFILEGFDFISTENDFPKIINLCADEGLSKYEVGKLIANNIGISEEMVRPIYLHDNKTLFRTPRADSTIMDNTIMKKWYGLKKIYFDVKSCK